MTDISHAWLIAGAGLLAGAMNALAGGGSFVTLPALIAVGVPSVQANASSTVALLPGGLASAWAYRKGLRPVGEVPLNRLLGATVIGGLVGSLLLLWTPSRLFDRVLPWLLLLASAVLIAGRPVGEWLRRQGRIHRGAVLSIQTLLGVYGGYFGGAVGIMMLAVWGLLDVQDLKGLQAPRTLLVSAANATAVVIFMVANQVRWPETLTMLVAATAGGSLGALLGRRAPARVVRAITYVLTLGITVAFFVRAYL